MALSCAVRDWRRVLAGALLAAALGIAAGAANADGPKPEVKSASVIGVPAGKTTTVILYGEGLAPRSVVVKPPLRVRIVGARDAAPKDRTRGSREVTLEVSAPATCPHDTFEVTLTQPDNAVVKTSLCVTEETAVEISIKKPCSTFATAMELPGQSTAVTGQLDPDTADVVHFAARAGEVWDIALLSSRAGSLVDPILRVRDSRHIPLALSAGDKKRDRHIELRVAVSGDYYVEITEAEARGGPGYTYRLAVVRRSPGS